ncbi:MAG: sodium-dependent transporter [Eubacteriales bacterium]|nr:sodium-dependent transporter [Eubacteriales bacterium]
MSEKSKFSGHFGFVMAAAGSAVGVGNLWRFPYLAAKDGGGFFLIIYLILVVTFGFTLLTSDIATGRKTQASAIHAYDQMDHRWKFLGVLTFLVPVIIMTYYAVIGGWITKYIVVFLTGHGAEAAADDFFTGFITSPVESSIYAVIFMVLTAIIIFNGVEGGIEKCSKFMMPVLIVLIVFTAVFSLTLKHPDSSGRVVTGIQGLGVYLKPDVSGMTVSRFLQILLDAMSQIFFSLSVSMGIMITYGSYVNKDVDLNKAVSQIEFFDTLVAFLAGMMIIPSIFVFSGKDGMAAGPGLMFVALPKVFSAMGGFGHIVGAAFFIMAAFATLTSCISVLESIVANVMEITGKPRKPVTTVLAVVYTAASVIIALGYSKFYVEIPLPNGTVGQLLDLMDYISNSFMMPFISFLSTILIGWILKPQWIIDEVEVGGVKMQRKALYTFMVRYAAPVIMILLFLQSTGLLNIILK